jgi:hypothetical protein
VILRSRAAFSVLARNHRAQIALCSRSCRLLHLCPGSFTLDTPWPDLPPPQVRPSFAPRLSAIFRPPSIEHPQDIKDMPQKVRVLILSLPR